MRAELRRGGFRIRLVGALLLRRWAYEEVEQDEGATGQAALVVLLGTLAAMLASLQEGPAAAVLALLLSPLSWALYSFLTWQAGTRLFPGHAAQADLGQLLRTLGFAWAPRLLLVLAPLPAIGPAVRVAAAVWCLAATVLALRCALDYDDWLHALAAAGVGWVGMLVMAAAASAAVGAVI